MESFKKYWKAVPSSVRKPLVFIFGSTIVIVGLALLILPGPGWVVIFLGFALLATEFVIAEKVRDWLVTQLKIVIEKSKKALRGFRRR